MTTTEISARQIASVTACVGVNGLNASMSGLIGGGVMVPAEAASLGNRDDGTPEMGAEGDARVSACEASS